MKAALLFLSLLGLLGVTKASGQQTLIPDSNFEQALIDSGHDNVLDGQVLTANINGVITLDVDGKNITDLTGIQDFIALEDLSCGYNQLTTLDVSNNINLTDLNCRDNALTTIDITNNVALEGFDIIDNALTVLNVSNNSALKFLGVNFNALSVLDVSNNIALDHLFCGSNTLSTLDLSNNTALTLLNCSNNQLTALNLRNNNNATIGSINGSNNPDLECVEVDDAVFSNQNWSDNGFLFNQTVNFSENCSYVPEILDFTIPGQLGATIIDHENNLVTISMPDGTDLTSLLPDIAVSGGGISTPSSGEFQDFSEPVAYTLTLSGGFSKVYNVTVTGPRFITTWDISDTHSLALSTIYNYNFQYLWLDDSGNTITSGSHTDNDGDFINAFDQPGQYQLEITGVFPHFIANDITQLLNVMQWGDIQWKSMFESFKNWDQAAFSAIDAPDLSQTASLRNMFLNAAVFNDDLDHWNVSTILSFASMFQNATVFNGNIQTWDVSNGREFFGMFTFASEFNQNISSWSTGEAINMRDMFRFATTFNQDLNNWTVSKVENMQGMFSNALLFNGNISNWDVGKVSTFDFMFQNAEVFNQDISNWNMESATNLSNMFVQALAFNQDIGSWNTENVTNMPGVFKGAASFDQDLSAWNVSSVINMAKMFNLSGLTPQNYDSTLIGWASLPGLQNNVELGAEQTTFCDAENSRSLLINSFNWTVIDAGKFCLTEQTDILSFILSEQTGPTIINTDLHTVEIEVGLETDVSALIPFLTISSGANSTPETDDVVDFTNPVTYTIVAQNGITSQDWVVYVTPTASNETDILSFELPQQTEVAIIDPENHTVVIKVEEGTDISTLMPVLTLSTGATSSPSNGEAVDFTNAIVFNLIAQDGETTQDWTVTVFEEEILGVKDYELVFNIYPNPVNDVLNINTQKNVRVTVTDFNDKNMGIDQFGSQIKLDLSHLSSGLYFLILEDGQNISVKKIIKN